MREENAERGFSAEAEEEGVMNKKIVWGAPIALVLLGLMLVLLSYAQPSSPATVTEIVKKSYTPARKMARGTAKAVYREEMKVQWGEGQTATVAFSSVHSQLLPKVGDEIRISRWFSGMVVHPNRTVIAVGGTMATIGGFFLVTFLLTKWSLARKKKKREAGSS